MARPGPPPQPPELRLLRGNPGKRRLPKKHAPKPTTGVVCPDELSEEAKKEWCRLAPELERLGILTVLDRAALAALCEAWADLVWALAAIRQLGRTATTEKGYEHTTAAMQVKSQAVKQLKELSAEFGFTPAARDRVHFPGNGQSEDPDEKFFGTPGPRPVPPPPAPPAPRARRRGAPA
jgi:P27 family predicted phage terminase small subunit